MKRLTGLLLIGSSLSAFWVYLYYTGGWWAILTVFGVIVGIVVFLIGVKFVSER